LLFSSLSTSARSLASTTASWRGSLGPTPDDLDADLEEAAVAPAPSSLPRPAFRPGAPASRAIQQFHLDTETVRAIESLDAGHGDRLPTTFRRFDPGASRGPSRLPRRATLPGRPPSPSRLDVGDLFVARTEELLRSSRAASSKKRRRATAGAPDRPASPAREAPRPDLIRQKTFDLPPSSSPAAPCPGSDGDAGIGGSLPSSVISDASLVASQVTDRPALPRVARHVQTRSFLYPF